TSRPFPIDPRFRRGRFAVKYNRRQGGWQRRGGMSARRPSMSAAFIFISLCAALVLILSAWHASRARAPDDEDEGEDSRGSAMVEEDQDNQGDDTAQGDEKGCGMMEVEVDDENGDVVDDMDEKGNPEDDVEVDVTEPAQSGVNQGTVLAIHT